MNRSNTKAFTILELLVVVAIIAILAVIAIPNFIGRIDEAKDSQELAEINAVGKAIATYYADNGVYPTLQGKDGTLLQAQPLEGAPHNIDFSSLVPDYLATLPHFSYWWVDAQGKVYHTQKSVGSVTGNVFTPTAGYSYTLYKTNGTTQAVTAAYTLLAGEYIIGADKSGTVLPKINSSFKNAKVHPESGEVVVPAVSFNPVTFTNAGLTGRFGPTQGQLDTAYSGTSLAGKVTSNNGIQLWTVPTTGTYKIEAYGAAAIPQSYTGAGGVNRALHGTGAIIKGDIYLTEGTQLKILVGQRPKALSNAFEGGGGGTFVAKSDNTPLVVAGGGGSFRVSYTAPATPQSYLDASISTSGVSTAYAGGTNGSGGTSGYNNAGGAGAGFYTAGTQNSSGIPPTSFIAGGNGGVFTNQTAAENGDGGFGGGGQGGFGGSGGGGGYSGGSAGNNMQDLGAIGGGGGSFNAGTNQSNTVGNDAAGKVIITYVGP